MQDFCKQLKQFGRVKLNEPLSRHTTFKIGGPADYFVIVEEVEKLIELLKFLQGEGIDYFVLGGGSNLLMNDEGFRGVVVQVTSYKLQVTSDVIEADAGVLLSTIVSLAVQNALTGLEWAVGIPGTVGGAVFGNAGAMGRDIASCIEKVEVLRDGEVVEFSKNECGFGYRESVFRRKGGIILRVWLKLVHGDKKAILEATQKYLAQRTGRYPDSPSAGSFFKNIKLDKWPGDVEELPELFRERGTVPVGWLVEQVGMKGYTVGGAKISDEHGNFIINFNNAKQEDVLKIVEEVKQRVYNRFGVELEEEVETV